MNTLQFNELTRLSPLSQNRFHPRVAIWRRAALLLCLSTLLLALAGCGDELSEEEAQSLANGGGGGGGTEYALTVGTGVNPTYTWTGGVIGFLAVQIVGGSWLTVWQISYYDDYPLLLGDGIVSPVTHGTIPADPNVYEIFASELTLTGGILYRATICNQAFDCDFQEFTP